MQRGTLAAVTFILGLAPGVSSEGVIGRPADGRPGHGLVGYGISMYQPTCAFACRSSITNPLNCSTSSSGIGQAMIEVDSFEEIEVFPDAKCYAENDEFLQTLAYCIYFHCHQEQNSTLQRYWELNAAGSDAVQPSPKGSYQEALSSIGFTPNMTINSTELLKTTCLVSEIVYKLEYNTMETFEHVEKSHATFG